MSIELPGWLTEPFSLIGMTWPEADEDLLNEAGDKWSRLASDLEQISSSALNAVQPVMAETKGDAAEAFDRYGDSTVGRFDPDADIADAWGRLRDGTAGPDDYTLLRHELAESSYTRSNPGVGYTEAHEHANGVANWEQTQR